MLRTRTVRLTALVAAALACAGAGAAVAQDEQPGTTTITVGPRTVLPAGSAWPTDFPGIRGDDRGQAIPARYRVIAYRVSITRGAQAVYPAFTARCPDRRLLQTFAVTGRVGPQIVGRSPFVRRRAFAYANQPEWGVVVDFNARASKPGDTLTGIVYAVCR